MTSAQIDSLRQEHKRHLSDTTNGVLNQKEIDDFEGLDYFPFSKDFQIAATFTKDKGKVFEMPTSTERLPKYRRYGFVDFVVDNDTCRLEVYQNMALKKNKEYRDYLFIPMRDLTSGSETYGGGRYIDITMPEADIVTLDFNKLYNPYCSYSHRYSCPIPPEVNTLKVEIKAGEKTPLGH